MDLKDKKGAAPSSEKSMEVAEEARAFEYEIPSFGSDLFMGKFSYEMLWPFPKQSKEEEEAGTEYIQQFEKFLVEELDPDQVDKLREIPQPIIKKLAEMGAFALKVPKEYDGLGLSQMNYNRAVMKVASYCGSTAVLLSAHQSIGVPQPLRLYGTEEQKKKFLPRFRQGAISAFALTETGVGSDPAQMKSEAVLNDAGTHYVLNGEKLWTTNGTIADIIIVIAKTAPKVIKGKERPQISAFILEMDTPGVEVTHRCEFMGLNGIYNGVLKFTDVKIPKENLLGDEGRGLAMALDTINVGRLTLPAACTGVAKQCLQIARKWGNERNQWGKPVGLHEAGREKTAYIAATTFAMEAISWLTSLWADNKTCDMRIEAAMAKMFSTEELWKITDLTLQLRGGRGYETSRSLKARGEPGYPVERMMRDCRVNMILEGSTEIMKLFLAREAMDPHIKELFPLLKGKYKGMKLVKEGLRLFGSYALWLPGLSLSAFHSYRQFKSFRGEFRYIAKRSRKLARKLFFAMMRHQKGLENRQMLLSRLMEIGTDLFVMAATCAYAQHLVDSKQADDSALQLAHYFSKLAKERIDSHFEGLKHNLDKPTYFIGKKFADGDFDWLEKGIIPIE